MSLVPYFAPDYVALAAGLLAISLCAGGLGGLVNGLIAMRSPPASHGASFGTAQVSHAVGVALGPLVGGAAVVTWGLRSVFLLEIAVYVVVLVVVMALLAPSRRAASERPGGD